MTAGTTTRKGEKHGGTDPAYLIFVTGPDRQTLGRIGRAVVEERLAACANVWDGLRSVYRWEGEVETAEESLALFKTTEDRLPALERRVGELHPYDEPEFLAVAVDRGSPSYLDWIAESVEG